MFQSYLLDKELIPTKVRELMYLFNKNSYYAYLVGGAVRDMILEKTPKDYDITTDATPEQMIELCEKENLKYIPTGLKHGTITIIYKELPIEATTFRIDGNYVDNRHPEEVIFTNSLEQDLSRRDLTINALAADMNGVIYDYFDGYSDLKAGKIKTVGDANDRFNEDALRMLRAYRFATQLDFKMEIPKGIFKYNLSLLRNISNERVRDELDKFLLGGFGILTHFEDFIKLVAIKFPKLMDLFMIQNNKWHTYQALTDHTAHVIFECKEDLTTRLAALLHDIGKQTCYSEEIIDGKICGHFYGHPEVSANIARDFLITMKYPNKMVDDVCFLVAEHDNEIAYTEKSVKKVLREIEESHEGDYSLFDKLIDLKFADRAGHNQVLLAESKLLPIVVPEYLRIKKEIIEKKEAFSLKDLAINGNDIIADGFLKGKEIGECLRWMLDIVLEKPEDNTREKLLEYLQMFKEMQFQSS